MVDFRVHDGASEHPKMRAAGPAAIGLWTMAGSYCMRPDVLSDGWVPQHYVMSWPNGKRLAAVLVKVGLWTPETRNGLPGWQFHDFLDIQRSAESVNAERESARDRMARLRQRKKANRSPDVRPNTTRTESERAGEVPPMFSDSQSLSLSPPTHLQEGEVTKATRASSPNPLQPRPADRCPQHQGHDDPPPCRACRDARVTAEAWDQLSTERRELIADAIADAKRDPRQRCHHGTDGGLLIHPDTGKSATCAFCRRDTERTAS